ncbi:hypothetical protein KIW84_066465 [Lathyrus oleraceus]|uniref:ATP-dependent DNA helicase n=1 Tax=Pisum sativum TaxID=3888 RepID=A0A9D4WHU5_PEA|nr:hypothetical protein KIW84_066465 [Pisum sativum]
MYYAPSRPIIRTPLSNITSIVLKERNMFSHSPGIATGSGISMKNFESVSTKQAAAFARERRKQILQRRISQSHDENFDKNSPSCFMINTPSFTHLVTPPSNITSPHSNARNLNMSAQPSTSAYKSKKQLNVGAIQSMSVKLLNYFANENHDPSSSSTPNSPVHDASTFNYVPNFNIAMHNSVDDTSTDDSISDSSCEFNVADGNYDSSFSLDDDEAFQYNSSSIDSCNIDYSDIGDPTVECTHCGTLMWFQEKTKKGKNCSVPKFQLCCGNGKVVLPLLKTPPLLLRRLLFDNSKSESINYQQYCRLYNMIFAFTSSGMKVDNRFQDGRGPPNLRIHGQVCHRIGSMLPLPGESPKFAQLYIFDTDNEVQNRIEAIGNNPYIIPDTVKRLKLMLDKFNTHAKSFRMAADRLKNCSLPDLKLKLISDRSIDGRIYNHPTVSEVAALIVGDVDTGHKRDILLERQSGQLKRISEFHPSYLSYQYPLLFPYGEDGFRVGVLLRETNSKKPMKRNKLTIREWLAFRIQSRNNEAQTLLLSRRLFQQFLVDGFTMMESQRLNYIRKHQKRLPVSKYGNLNDGEQNANTQGSNKGKRVVLPSTYVGSRRFMEQLYFDGMAICSHFGFPDLFITFTCNPNWPEIQRLVAKNNLNSQDRPNIIFRVFKIKFDELLCDLTKKHVLGRVVAYIYTIEFQKRGLPHSHILLFLHPSSKYPTPDDIDKIISAEIPTEQDDKPLYDLVKTHMIHGPCGIANRSSPCMKDGKCSKYFPKKFQPQAIVDQDGYPMYRRRETGNTVMKKQVQLDNRYVVPYNPYLLKKYQAHVNMEWCNQSTSIKYLFKYINKGYDRITDAVVQTESDGTSVIRNVDEIKQYLDCRYVSPSEACWRLFSFPIHGRSPAVERLYFHLEGDNSVYYTDYELIDEVLNKPSVKESMFTAWMEANKIYFEAQNLTYSQFLTKFVYDRRYRRWRPRKRGHTIGRLIWVPPSTGGLYYLRGGVFFLHGYGGTGKTFMWITLSSALRSQKKIVLTVASSGIASLLLPGGRTAHSKFKIPVPTLDNSTCNINKDTDHSQLLEATDVIIWDEAPMSHRHCFETLDKTLKDVMSKKGFQNAIFGGKVLKLTKNMRLRHGRDNTSSDELAKFSKWILQVGDGKISEPNDGLVDIEIPKELLISNFEDPIRAIVDYTYPNLLEKFQDVTFLQGKVILASTIEVVDRINHYILDLIPGEEKEYLSFDSIDRTNTTYNESYEVLTPEFLSKLRTSGIPNHKIKLKVGTPIMLMRNLDQVDGLCNGTRLIVTRLANHVIEAKIMSGKNIGNIFYIPRMSMSPSDSPWPFKLIRRQFPIIVSYAMTINKSQGQSLDSVGLYLPTPVFSHGQLYVAISRVKSKSGLKILIHDKDNSPCSTTTNIVYKEVFEALG